MKTKTSIALAVAVTLGALAGCVTPVPFRPSRSGPKLARGDAAAELGLLLKEAARPRSSQWDWTSENDPLRSVRVGPDGFAFLAGVPIRRPGTVAHQMVRVDKEYAFGDLDPHAYVGDEKDDIVVCLSGELSSGGRGNSAADPRNDCLWFRSRADAERFLAALDSLRGR